MKKLKTIFINSILVVLKRIKSQVVWENLFQLSLKQMNYGNGAYFNDSGELFVCRHIYAHLQNETLITVFDVGANVGNYSKALSEVFTSKTKIYAFEPSKKTYERFKETTSGISMINSYNFGFSDSEQHLTLHSDSEGSGLASVYQRNLDQYGIILDKNETIKLTTIDQFCKLNAIEQIHFLKLDIEGHELNALMGAKNMIKDGKINFIQFEFGGCNIDSRTYFRDFFYLLNDQFKIYRVLKNGIREIPSYDVSLEIFTTVNYLAIKR